MTDSLTMVRWAQIVISLCRKRVCKVVPHFLHLLCGIADDRPTMKRKTVLLESPLLLSAVLAATCASIPILACSTDPTLRLAAAHMPQQGSETSSPRNTEIAHKVDPAINLDCVYDHIRNPEESFQYAFAKDTSNDDHVNQEAEVTPESIDGRYRDEGEDHVTPFQAARTDPRTWSAAIAHLTGISGMSSAIAMVSHNSALRREHDGGKVNGYDTVHYSIDTARFSATEHKMFGPGLGPGGFEKGDVWVNAQGCPVKLALDSELHKPDGSLLLNVHYEEAMIKK